ncbi:MAG: hypothetical protein MJZ48_02150 [Paludibacteraceae bacterium]|nr:hypothetical protein [Paludibacteraceae bacterium]
MRKIYFSLLAILTLFAACKPHPNVGDVDKATLVGRWKVVLQDNQPVLTDNRIVFCFNADGTGTQTLAADLNNVGEKAWYVEQRLKYTLEGNALHTQWMNSSVVLEWLASITSMTDQQFVVAPSRVLLQTEPLSDMPQSTWQRVSEDYRDDIIGLWEGTSHVGITYGDHNHRWLYTPSGQYFYYSQDSVDGKGTGKWVISENSLNEYDVDGDYLACRWKQTEDAKEDREFWDITINDKNMSWSALRQAADGQLFNASFTMRRVSPTSSEMETYLPGKWVAYMIDGKPLPTNEKSVHTFDGHGAVYYTISDTVKDMSEWHNQLKLNYSTNGDYLVEKGLDKNGNMVQWRSSVAEMNNSEMLFYAFSSMRDIEGDDQPYHEIRLQKINADYRQMILCGKDSIWKGVDGEGKYGDYHHLWEYQDADATGTCRYIYYSNVDGKWQNDDAEPGKYMVDGNWLATGWKEQTGEYNYEWWDIEIVGDTMKWSGIREDGLNTFTLVKVPKSSVGPFRE